ncbi:MAG: hypothetical protein D6732_10300 [Methanobacteriota archaeon]|nr:MAG: hypothetical protein D6732_10300 [Euryarchaeota archaeon]
MQQSPYTEDEIVEMINSDNLEDISTGARNLWTFWDQWEHKEKFEGLGERLLTLLKSSIEALPKGFTGSYRPAWHFLLSLGVLQYEPAHDYIFSLLVDTQIVENVRGFAADALSRYPPQKLKDEQLERIWELAEKDESLPVRVNCIRAIANNFYNSKSDDVAKRLWEMMKRQTNPAIKTTIMGAIGEIGSMSVVPDLIHTLITRRTPALKKDAGLTLDRIAEVNGMNNRDDLIKSFSNVD